MSVRANAMARIVEKQFLGASIRLHILHHASREKVFGVGLIEELRRHGYRLSPGTLYPILHALERNGYLRSSTRIVSGRHRRFYVATPAGKSALRLSRPGIVALMRELCQNGSDRRRASPPPKAGTVARRAKQPSAVNEEDDK